MAGPRHLMVFCYGLFTIAAQTLLFREYMAAFKGQDIGIGLFFGTSSLWLAVGAFLFRTAQRRVSSPFKAAELLLLGCIPAFCLQYGLIVLVPGATATGSYLAWSLRYALGWSLLSTAPMCMLLGLLFPILRRWVQEPDGIPLGRLIVLAASGGVLGGLGVTALLYQELSPAGIFQIITIVVCASAALSALAGSPEKACWVKRTIIVICLLTTLVAGFLRVDRAVTRGVERYKWSRIVPGGTFGGSFSTAQAEYLYGTDQGRWVVVCQGGIHETVGDQTAAGRVAALALCQNSMTKHVLVIGDGLSLCQRILQSPQIEAVDWHHPDPRYVQSMQAHLPESFQIDDARLHYLTGDIRTTLAQSPETYDMVIVNFAEPMNVARGRFASVEFFETVEQSLRGLGLLAFGIPGGEKGPTNHPAYLGASIYQTLHTTFAQTIVVPAEKRTFFLSSASSYLEISPVTLEIRFSMLPNAEAIFPPALLSSVYLPDRALEVLKSYDAVDLPEERLLNHDDRPSLLLCHLLEMAGRSGVPWAKPVHLIQRGGPILVLVPIVLLVLGRLIYVLRTASRRAHTVDMAFASVLRSDSLFVIASSGAASAGAVIVFLYACQKYSGALYLHAGLMASLFLAALTVGALVIGAIGSLRGQGGSQGLYPILCTLTILSGIHAMGFIAAGLWLDHMRTGPAFAMLLAASGLFYGATLGLGAGVLEICRHRADSAAGDFAGADHLGAAIGSSVAALLLIPLVGLHVTLFALAVLAFAGAAFVVAAYYCATHPGPRRVAHPTLTPLGYALLALAGCVVVEAHIVAYVERSQAKSQSTTVIQEWIENRRVSEKTATLATTSEAVTYLEVREGSRLEGYILRSEDFTDTVYGYGGPMSLIMFADPSGTLVDYHVTRSRETPRYIRRIRAWMESLKGRSLFGPTPIEGIDSVSGATLSCDAIVKLLRRSGRQFAISVLAQDALPHARTPWTEKIDWPLACWLVALILAPLAIWHGRVWSRIAVLAYTVGVAGFWLNRQYSTDHVIRLLDANGLLAGPIGALLLVVGIPLLVLLFGNIYCGYLCPFGALQEMLSFLTPRRFKARLPLTTVAAGRFVKYVVLFVLVVAFFTTGSKRFLEADPLTLFFSRQFWIEGFWTSPGLVTAACVLVGTLLLTRLWCRYLCPTGAFLSLFNAAGWLKRFLPAKKFGRCEFGLSGRDHLDCIYCDRCRYESRLIPERNDIITRTAPGIGARLFLVLILCMAALTLVSVFRTTPTPPPLSPATTTDQTSPAQSPTTNTSSALDP